jgi:K+-sensing histidine kinase KdpD
MKVTDKRRPRIRSFTAQVLLGIVGLAVTTVVCFHLGFGVARTGFAYVILLALVSVLGSFSAAIVLSIIGAACLNYFFAPPLFEFRIDARDDIERIAAFLTTSLVVNALVAKLRRSEARFRTFVDYATDAFFVLDDRLTVLDVNRQACEGWVTCCARWSWRSDLHSPLSCGKQAARCS